MQTLHIKPSINMIHTNKNRIFANEWKLVLEDLTLREENLLQRLQKGVDMKPLK